MVAIKPICERFDNLYELSGGKEVESVKKLKVQIEEAYQARGNVLRWRRSPQRLRAGCKVVFQSS